MGFSKFFIVFTLASVLLFAFFPEIDLEVSGLFYHENGGFYLKNAPFFSFMHDAIRPLLIVTVLVLLFFLLYPKKSRYLDRKAAGFLLTFLLLGPGLITNVVFKEHSGRVRPVHIVQFVVDKAFTPYYKLTGTCQTNCSFFSGHAAAAFFFMAFGYVYRSRKLFFLGLFFGALMALTRVVQGGHFLSDVVFAFIVNFIVLKVLYYLFYKKEASLA